jgi:large subunit ribosomal protein L13
MTAKTYSPRPRDIERNWYVVDADGAVLGRLASEVAKILRGKHKPMFAPHMDTGDHVIVVNAAGVRLTGTKAEQKVYYRHSGYPGGIREQPYSRLMAERPTLVVEKAIRGMLPKTRLGRQMISKLAVYAGPEHPHQAQKPKALALGGVPVWEGLPVAKPKPVVKPKAAKAGGRTKAKADAGTRAEAGTKTGTKAEAAGSGSKTRRAVARSTSRGATGTVRRGSGAATSRGSKADAPKRTRAKPEAPKES